MDAMPKISAVICTYNRSQLLRGAIESLLNQTLNRSEYEIIVVNNASTDNTSKVVNKFITDFKDFNIKYIFESEQGLSHARNAGFKNAKTDFVAYIDDDAKADKNWLKEAIKIIDEIKPDIFGGPIYPFYLTEKPEWFLDRYEIRTNGNDPRFLNENEYISGSNIIFKKKVLELLGGFDTNLGMNGEKLGYGEETRLILKARDEVKNVKIYYSPKIFVYHLVPEKKMRFGYFVEHNFAVGNRAKDIWQKEITLIMKIIYFMVVIYDIVCILLQMALGTMFRNRRKYRYANNYIIEVVCPHLLRLSHALSMIKSR